MSSSPTNEQKKSPSSELREADSYDSSRGVARREGQEDNDEGINNKMTEQSSLPVAPTQEEEEPASENDDDKHQMNKHKENNRGNDNLRVFWCIFA